MKIILFCVAVGALTCAPEALRADDKLKSLLESHDKAVNQACLNLHRKLEAELEKIRAQRAQAADETALKKVENELRVIRQTIKETSAERSASGTGVALKDLAIWHVGGHHIWGDWRNMGVETATNGTHKISNKSTLSTLIFFNRKFASDFEVEIKYIGQVDSAGLVSTNPMGKEAIIIPGTSMAVVGDKPGTLVVKRKGQEVTFEVNKKPVTQVEMRANEPLFECYVMINMPPNTQIQLFSWEAGAE